MTEPNATDAAVKYAAEKGIDLNDVTGSGKDKRIGKPDVEAYEAAHDTEQQAAAEDAEERQAEEVTDPEEGRADVVGLPTLRELVPHLTQAGLDEVEEKAAHNDRDDVLELVASEREGRTEPDDEDPDTEFLKQLANIKRRPLSRSVVAKLAKARLRERGEDWH